MHMIWCSLALKSYPSFAIHSNAHNGQTVQFFLYLNFFQRALSLSWICKLSCARLRSRGFFHAWQPFSPWWLFWWWMLKLWHLITPSTSPVPWCCPRVQMNLSKQSSFLGVNLSSLSKLCYVSVVPKYLYLHIIVCTDIYGTLSF